jgi:hypothetical protein
MKRFLAFLLTVCLVMSLTTVVFANETGIIEGDVDVESYVFTVDVPMDLDFIFDPAQVSRGPSQISNVDFDFTNTSEFATLIAFYLDIEVADGVALKADSAMDDFALFSASDKELSFGIIAAKEYDDGEDEFVYDENNADSIVEVDILSSGDGYLEFGLVMAGTHVSIAGVVDKDGANEANMVASFQFFSRMNAYALWKADDISVSGLYLLAAVNPATLALSGGVLEADTTGLVNVALPSVVPPFGFVQSGALISNVDNTPFVHANGDTISGKADFDLDEGDADGKIIPFAFDGKTLAAVYFSEDDISYADATATFEQVPSGIELQAAWDATPAGPFFLFIILSDGSAWQLSMTINDI